MAVVDSEQLRAGRGLRLLLGPDESGWVEHQWLPRILFRPSMWQCETGHVQQQRGAVRKLRRHQGAAQRGTNPYSSTDPDPGAAESTSNNAGSDSTDSKTDTTDFRTEPAPIGVGL